MKSEVTIMEYLKKKDTSKSYYNRNSREKAGLAVEAKKAAKKDEPVAEPVAEEKPKKKAVKKAAKKA